MKINNDVMIYKINNQFFIRNRDQVFEIEYGNDQKQLLKYLRALEGGVPDSFIDALDKEERKKFGELCIFFSKNNLLDNQKVFRDVGMKRPSKDVLISIETKNSVFKEELVKILQANGLKVQNFHEHSSVFIFVADQYTKEEDIQKINQKIYQTKNTWLFVDLGIGNYGAIGPFIIPGITACYNCFVKRKLTNDDAITKHHCLRKEFIKKGLIQFSLWQYTFMASMIAHEMLLHSSGLTPDTAENILYADFNNLETWKEGLLRYPRCEICA